MNQKLYHILMILTDGDCHDMQESIDELVELSGMPISIIIIGLGNDNFDRMEVFDCDEGVLKDSVGNKAFRDIVQFVKYSDFKK